MIFFSKTLVTWCWDLNYFWSENTPNKKVLLRERKRHTARRVASTPYVVLTGYPPPRPDLAGGVPDLGTPQQGTPRQGTPPARSGWGGTWPGYPPSRVPPGRYTPAGYPPGRVPLLPRLDLAGYHPPPGGCPMAFWEMLQSIMGYGYPPPRCEQTNKVKLLPSRRTTYAGGNNH